MAPDRFKVFETQGDMVSPLVGYKQKGHQVELIGKEESEGPATYKLKVTRKSGTIEFHHLDAVRFLTVRIEGKVETGQGEFTYETRFADHRDVDGLLVAHSLVQTIGGKDQRTTTFDKVEINVELPDNMFTMPASWGPESVP
jgi:hypothetical protein